MHIGMFYREMGLVCDSFMFRTDDQFVSLINGAPVDQPGTRLCYNYPVV